METDSQLEIKQGDTYEIELAITDELAVAVDLTGHVFSGQLRESPTSTNVIATFAFTILDQVTDTGKVLAVIDSVQTTAIPVAGSGRARFRTTEYAFDIQSVYAGKTRTWAQGVAVVIPQVTR